MTKVNFSPFCLQQKREEKIREDIRLGEEWERGSLKVRSKLKLFFISSSKIAI